MTLTAKPRTDIAEALKLIAQALSGCSGEDDMASLKINDAGTCYLSIGLSCHMTLTINETAERIENVLRLDS